MEVYKREYKTKDGETRWSFLLDVTIDGKRIRRTLKGADTLKQARRMASTLLRGLEAELDGKKSRRRLPLPLEAVLEHDRERVGISPFTARQEAASAKHLVRILGAKFDLSRMTGADVDSFIRQRASECYRGKQISPRTVNLDLELLRAALVRLVDQGRLSEMPCKIKPLPRVRKQKRALTRNEALALLKASQQTEGLFEVLAFLLNTGLRRSELYSLRWDHVDFEMKTMTVLTKKKGTSGLIYEDRMPLNAVCLAILEEMRRQTPIPSGLIFGRETRHGDFKGTVDGIPVFWDHNLGDKIKDAAKKAGIEWWQEVSAHTLRHTFGSLSIRCGASLKDVSSLMRHRDPMMTVRTYLHEQEDSMRSAVDSLALTVSTNGTSK